MARDGEGPDRIGPVRNEVMLVGRIGAEPQARTMPSGDEIVTFRLIVDRPERARGPAGRVRVDTFDCTAWRADARRRVAAMPVGQVVEVSGCLRRRFWRAGGGAASRVEVEVDRVRRVPVPR
jgi:single-strand DNA-binding protein